MSSSDRVVTSFQEADLVMADMSAKDRWNYLVAAQDHFWAVLRNVEDHAGIEINSCKSLDDYRDAEDYRDCTEDD